MLREFDAMSKTQNLVLIAALALVAVLSTYTYFAKQSHNPYWYSAAQVSQGQQLFADHCAACHGAQAQGAQNWMQPDAIGNRPAPPLNGTGHAWHHSLADLANTISVGRGNMPAWQFKLSDAEIMAVLAWTQSQWPAPTYTAWSEANP
jgi:mono/diheme cytochrome c family protein